MIRLYIYLVILVTLSPAISSAQEIRESPLSQWASWYEGTYGGVSNKRPLKSQGFYLLIKTAENPEPKLNIFGMNGKGGLTVIIPENYKKSTKVQIGKELIKIQPTIQSPYEFSIRREKGPFGNPAFKGYYKKFKITSDGTALLVSEMKFTVAAIKSDPTRP